MGVTAGIVSAIVAVAGEGYAAISGNQRAQEAKGKAQTLLDQAPTAAGDAAKSAAAGRTAADAARRRAQNPTGFGGTILTGGSGITAPAPTQRKTLLGL